MDVNSYKNDVIARDDQKIHGTNATNQISSSEGPVFKTNDREENPRDTFPNRIFTKVDKEAQFPGGPAKWAQYIQSIILENIKDFSEKDFGTCIVRFIVDESGNVSDVEATTMQGTDLAKVSVDAIRNGPKWIPAMQNNRIVNAYRLQPVTLTNPNK
jgi:protein TonB